MGDHYSSNNEKAMKMHCTNCGISIESAPKFCSNCGAPAANNSVPVTSQPTYSFVVTGEIVEGQTLDAVKDNLEKFIKLDRKALDVIFAKKNVVLKKDIDKETAEKYIKAFIKCGAICDIIKIDANKPSDSLSDNKTQPSTSSSNPKTVATSQEIKNDIDFRIDKKEGYFERLTRLNSDEKFNSLVLKEKCRVIYTQGSKKDKAIMAASLLFLLLMVVPIGIKHISESSSDIFAAVTTGNSANRTLETQAMNLLDQFAEDPNNLGFFCDKVTNRSLKNMVFGTATSGQGKTRFPAMTADFSGTCIKRSTGDRDTEYVNKFSVIFAMDDEAGMLRCYKIVGEGGLDDLKASCSFKPNSST